MKPLNIKAKYEKLYYGKGYVNGHYKNWWDNKSRDNHIPLKKVNLLILLERLRLVKLGCQL